MLKLWFAGTRGNIKARSARHRMHSSLVVQSQGKRVLLDCGDDWLGKIGDLRPDAIAITHAHPDHIGGLKEGAPCPVYATRDTFALVKRFPLDRVVVPEGERFFIADLAFKPLPVEHSLLAPAVAYRIETGRENLVLCP